MKIVVLAGGISTERDVSLSSGTKAYKALKKNGHQVIILDVFLGYEGEDWNSVFEQKYDWDKEIGFVNEEIPDLEQVKAKRPHWKRNFFGPHVIEICQLADVVFMALHGENGENGKIQAYFDLMGIRYTGTDYASSAMAMNKSIAKDIFGYYHIPTPAGISIKKGESIKKIPYPCVVKACSGGSSVGVGMANNDEEFEKALEEAFRYDQEVIVEQYINGREFSVGVMDGRALPVIEIAPKQGFYDYKNKYQAGSTVETCPAELSEEKTRLLQETAEKVFVALRLKNYARMDFRMNEEGDIFCLEANTLPGLTPTSLLPQEAAAEGTSYEELCEQIIQASFRS